MSGAHRYEKALFPQRPVRFVAFLQPVCPDPLRLAAVHENLGMGTYRVKENGRGEHDGIGRCHLVQDLVKLIVDDASAAGFTAIDFQAGGDPQIPQLNLVN